MLLIMARPKEFIREEALEKAITVFSNHGFAGSSTDTLRKAMGLSRQSMYDTFGDKRALYLEALRRYNSASVANIIRALLQADEPLAGLENALTNFVKNATENKVFGCLGLHSVCEFGISDAEIMAVNGSSGHALQAALEQCILKGVQNGSIDPALNYVEAAQYVSMTFAGLKLAARSGAGLQHLLAMVKMTIGFLKA